MTFTAGQTVQYAGMTMPATIISGPHPTYGADRWLVRKADGKVSLVKAGLLSAIKDRRTRVAEALFASLGYTGGLKPFDSLNSSSQRQYLQAADKVIAALDEDAKPAKRALAVGDRIRILRSNLSYADVSRGDVLKVLRVKDMDFHAETSKLVRGYFVFHLSDEGTGWERV